MLCFALQWRVIVPGARRCLYGVLAGTSAFAGARNGKRDIARARWREAAPARLHLAEGVYRRAQIDSRPAR